MCEFLMKICVNSSGPVLFNSEKYIIGVHFVFIYVPVLALNNVLKPVH